MKAMLVEVGGKKYVTYMEHPFLFELANSSNGNGIWTPFGDRKNVSTGVRFNFMKHRIVKIQ